MRNTSTATMILRAALAGLAYWIAMTLSYHFGGGSSAEEANIWIASGVSIGVLTLAEPVRWPMYAAGLALGAFVANVTSGSPIIASLVYAFNEVLVAAITAWLLRRLLETGVRLNEARKSGSRLDEARKSGVRLDSARRVWLFVAVGAFGSAVASWLVAIVAYAALGLPSPAEQWRLWIVSGTVGTLVLTPLMFAWADFRAKRSGGATMADFGVGGPLFVLLIGTALLVFQGNPIARFSGSAGYALTYLPLPFLVLGSLVWGARGATLSTFVLAAIAVLFTVRGEGPFAGIEGFLGEDVVEVQGYVAAAALLTLMLTALNASRQHALREAAEWKIRYEAVIAASDQLLYELDPVSGRLNWAGDTGRLLGLTADRIENLAAYLERVHPDDREQVRDALHALASGEAKHLATAHRFVSAAGEERLLESEANAIIDFDDTVHRVVGFLRPMRTSPAAAGAAP